MKRMSRSSISEDFLFSLVKIIKKYPVNFIVDEIIDFYLKYKHKEALVLGNYEIDENYLPTVKYIKSVIGDTLPGYRYKEIALRDGYVVHVFGFLAKANTTAGSLPLYQTIIVTKDNKIVFWACSCARKNAGASIPEKGHCIHTLTAILQLTGKLEPWLEEPEIWTKYYKTEDRILSILKTNSKVISPRNITPLSLSLNYHILKDLSVSETMSKLWDKVRITADMLKDEYDSD